MRILKAEQPEPKIKSVIVTDESLTVDLFDGRTVSVPLAWFPRLLHGTREERNNWRLIGLGEGIHWPDLDEDVSAENLLFGRPSAESQTSFQRWLNERSIKVARRRQRQSSGKNAQRTAKGTSR